MTEQDFENLAKRWPELFEKSGNFEFSIDRGWYNIIDVLCAHISHDVDTAKRRLRYAVENPTSKWTESRETLEATVAKAIEDLPKIEQVKEKFGTLRFYIDRGNPKIDAYISFAESMSGRTCEVCGAPGTSRNDGWIKVLCDAHHKKDPVDAAKSVRFDSGPKLSDE